MPNSTYGAIHCQTGFVLSLVWVYFLYINKLGKVYNHISTSKHLVTFAWRPKDLTGIDT